MAQKTFLQQNFMISEQYIVDFVILEPWKLFSGQKDKFKKSVLEIVFNNCV